jgi:prepilin-type N-terminal cleavage/methylation domain-containing protein
MKKINTTKIAAGFTLIELLVTISIIAILSAILYAGFEEARSQARDKARMTALKEVQLALEFYKAQNGVYPAQGCGGAGSFAGPGSAGGASFASCDIYILGLVPDFIGSLPRDPKSEDVASMGYYYRSDGNSYKLMINDSVENSLVNSYGDEFARCPSSSGGCAGAVPANTYAVYSVGAESW